VPAMPVPAAAVSRAAPAAAPAPAADPAARPAGVDPMQWWGALTQQFTELASKAMQDSSAIATRNLAAAAAAKAPAAPAKKAAPAKASAKAARKRA
jgi:hypothetical protein